MYHLIVNLLRVSAMPVTALADSGTEGVSSVSQSWLLLSSHPAEAVPFPLWAVAAVAAVDLTAVSQSAGLPTPKAPVI